MLAAVLGFIHYSFRQRTNSTTLHRLGWGTKLNTPASVRHCKNFAKNEAISLSSR